MAVVHRGPLPQRILLYLYVLVYFGVGALLVINDVPETVAWGWAPFGAVLVGFFAAIRNEGKLGRGAAAAIAALITVSLPWFALCALLGLLEELEVADDELLRAVFFLLSGVALVLWVLQAIWMARRLAADRRRGLLRLALWPTLLCAGAAAASGLILAVTPNLPEQWFEGLIAMIALSWCALAAAWLAGAWLIVWRARAALAPEPVPAARVL